MRIRRRILRPVKPWFMSTSVTCYFWSDFQDLFVWFFTFQLCRDGSSCVEPVLSKNKCVLHKDTTQWRRWGSNLWSLRLKSSTLPLSHCAPWFSWIFHQKLEMNVTIWGFYFFFYFECPGQIFGLGKSQLQHVQEVSYHPYLSVELSSSRPYLEKQNRLIFFLGRINWMQFPPSRLMLGRFTPGLFAPRRKST